MKILLLILVLLLSHTPECKASFDYSGNFTVNSQQNDNLSYYILLKENTEVSFVLSAKNKELSDSIRVSKVKLTSDDSIQISSDEGIRYYKIPTTGIYEVSVCLNERIKKDISFDLSVIEKDTAKNDSNISNQQSEKSDIENTNVFSSKEKESTVNVVSEVKEEVNNSATNKFVDDSNEESNLYLIKESNISKSEPTENKNFQENTEDIVAVDKINSDPETIIEKEISKKEIPSNYKSITVVEPPVSLEPPLYVNYSGKLKINNYIDIYEDYTEKNKCWPQALYWDNGDKLWVLDSQLCRIQCFASDGTRLKAFGKKGNGAGELGLPVSLAVNNNTILVGDRLKHCIHVFDHNGNWLGALQSDSKSNFKLVNPISICYKENEILVGDRGLDQITCFDSNYRYKSSLGSSESSKLDSISSIAILKDSIIVLEETGNIKSYSFSGDFLSSFSTNSNIVNSLYIDKNDKIWICDNENCSVKCFSKDGIEITKIGIDELNQAGETRMAFSPMSITINSQGIIAIADGNSRQIKLLELK